MSKTATGNFFEDFRIGQEIRHATARTVTTGEAALYLAMTGSRFLAALLDPFASSNGLPGRARSRICSPSTSCSAHRTRRVAQRRRQSRLRGRPLLGPGLSRRYAVARSTVIGLKETSSGQTGIVWVRSQGWKSDGTRCSNTHAGSWSGSAIPPRRRHAGHALTCPSHVTADRLVVPAGLRLTRIDPVETGSPYFFEDYGPASGSTMSTAWASWRARTGWPPASTRTARASISTTNRETGPARRLHRLWRRGDVAGAGARFNGLGNALHLLALNAGSHVNPCRAGDTIYAWSEVLETAELAGRTMWARCACGCRHEGPPLPRLPAARRCGTLSGGHLAGPRLLGSWSHAVRLRAEGRNWSCGKPGCRLNRLSSREDAGKSGSAHASTPNFCSGRRTTGWPWRPRSPLPGSGLVTRAPGCDTRP